MNPAPAKPIDGHRRALAVFILCLAPYLAFVAWFDFVTDDAYINFRYAHHLAQGLGFVYNPGVDPPVEGTGEFLWVLLLTPIEWLGWNPALWSRLLSVAAGLALLWNIARFLIVELELAFAPVAAACLCIAILPPFTAWSTGGLSTMPFALLLFLVYRRLLGPRVARGDWITALLSLALLLLRAESLPWLLLIVGIALAFARIRGERARRTAAWRTLAASLAVFAVFEAWRIHYFGYPLPNTAYAKVGWTLDQFERGLYYIARFFVTLPAVGLMILAIVGALRRDRSPAIVGAVALALIACAFSVFVGGDFMGMFRFALPVIPFLAVLLAAALARMWAGSALQRRLAALLVVLNVGGAILLAFGHEPVRDLMAQVSGRTDKQTQLKELRWQRYDAELWGDLGRYLKRYAKPADSLIALGIGAVGYTSDITIFDRHGLVTTSVSHGGVQRIHAAAGHDLRAGIRFFEPQHPTYAYAGLHSREELNHPNPALVSRLFDKFGDSEMTKVYRPVVVELPETERSGRYMLLAERVTDRGHSEMDLGWRETLLVPANLRVLP